MRYHGQPHVAKKAPWDGGFVWSTTPDGKPWVASAVEGEGCDLFWPCIDHPMGKPKQVDEHITVPAPLVAAGNGIAIGPVLLGCARPVHILTPSATVRRIVNMTALAVVEAVSPR